MGRCVSIGAHGCAVTPGPIASVMVRRCEEGGCVHIDQAMCMLRAIAGCSMVEPSMDRANERDRWHAHTPKRKHETRTRHAAKTTE